jgi:hypothetical protein
LISWLSKNVQNQGGNKLTNVCDRATPERNGTATTGALEAAEDNKGAETILKYKADIGTEVGGEVYKEYGPAPIVI